MIQRCNIFYSSTAVLRCMLVNLFFDSIFWLFPLIAPITLQPTSKRQVYILDIIIPQPHVTSTRFFFSHFFSSSQCVCKCVSWINWYNAISSVTNSIHLIWPIRFESSFDDAAEMIGQLTVFLFTNEFTAFF